MVSTASGVRRLVTLWTSESGQHFVQAEWARNKRDPAWWAQDVCRVQSLRNSLLCRVQSQSMCGERVYWACYIYIYIYKGEIVWLLPHAPSSGRPRLSKPARLWSRCKSMFSGILENNCFEISDASIIAKARQQEEYTLRPWHRKDIWHIRTRNQSVQSSMIICIVCFVNLNSAECHATSSGNVERGFPHCSVAQVKVDFWAWQIAKADR